MDEVDRYRVITWWASGQSGLARSSCAANAIHFSSPPALGGMEGRWTPEELLLCSIASCYMATFWGLAESANFEYTDLQVDAEGALRADSGYGFAEIFMHASLTIRRRDETERACDLLYQARALCPICLALSIEQKFEPSVNVGGP